MPFIILTGYSFFVRGDLSIPLLVGLGGTIGIPMGLMYPFPVQIKVLFVLGLLVSLSCIVYGLRNHRKPIGQLCTVTGIFVWLGLGFIGLSTGT